MPTHITSTRPIGANGWRPNSLLPGGIVVAVDGSQDSVAALETARMISERKDWTVHVVSVLSPLASYPLDDGFDEPRSEVDALCFQLREAAVRKLLESVEADPGWSSEVLAGSPGPLIAEVAASRQADLLVIGRLQHGPIERSSESVTTLEAMRLSPVPVFAVGSRCNATDTIVVATDFSAASEEAARTAVGLLGPNGKVYLAHVEPPVALLAADLGPPGTYLTDVADRFAMMIMKLDAPRGIIVEPVLLSGSPVTSILEFAERTGAQLIVSASGRRSRHGCFLLGSFATGLVCGATGGVLVFPSPRSA